MAQAAHEAALTAERAKVAAIEVERDQLRVAYQHLQHELALMRRRLFTAKAERLDTTQLELELGQKVAALDALHRELGWTLPTESTSDGVADPTKPPSGGKRTSSRRRDLLDADLPEERIELTDLVLEGTAERNGWEESARLSWRRAGFVRLIVPRTKYRETSPGGDDQTVIVTTPLPPELLPRSMATPSMLAHVITEKWCDGMPYHRRDPAADPPAQAQVRSARLLHRQQGRAAADAGADRAADRPGEGRRRGGEEPAPKAPPTPRATTGPTPQPN